MSAALKQSEKRLARGEAVEIKLPTVVSKALPHLNPQYHEKAKALAEQIDPSDARLVLNLGGQAQERLAEFSSTVMEQTKLAEAGNTGVLLGQLLTLVRRISPESLSGPTGAAYYFAKLLPWGESLQQRIDGFTEKHTSMKPAIAFLSSALSKEHEIAIQGIDRVKILRDENTSYTEALLITRYALALALNKAATSFEEARLKISSNADMSELGALRRKWNDWDRLDRRSLAIEASLTLANTQQVNLSRIEEMLEYNCETLQEARRYMIPTWNAGIMAAITTLKAKDQVEMVEAFRSMNDQLVEGTADLIAETEAAQSNMKKRTFIAAEVVARVNDKIAASITNQLSVQRDAKIARAEQLKLMIDSQGRVIDAMRSAGQELVATTGAGNSVQASTADLAANLLEGV